MRCLARRRAPVIRTPSSRLANSSAEGCSTSEGSSTSARSISAPATSPCRSSFMVSTSGSSGIRVFIPVRGCPSPAGSYRFARDEGGVALLQREVTVRSHRAHPEARPFEFRGQLRRIIQPHAMHLFVPPVVLAHLAETHDPALHRTPPRVLLELGEHGPVLPHAETPLPVARPYLAGTERVEDKEAARDERVVNAPEEATQAPLLVLRVEEVVEDLAYGRDRSAMRDLALEERTDAELGLGRPAAGELHHRPGDVYTEGAVTGVDQLPRQESAPAPEVDDEATAQPILVHNLQYPRRRSEGELGVADVVDVGEVLPVPRRLFGTSRGYLSSP